MTNKVEVVDSKIAALEFERENGNLFDLTQEQRVHLLKYEGELLDFRPQLVTSFTALDRLNGITKERDIKIKAILDDLREQSDQIKIAQNVSVLYLTVLEIGERECWTQAQIAEVFTKQLDFNHEVSVVTKDLAKKRLRGGELPSNRVIGAAYNKLAKRIPSWYKLDTMAWQNFIFSSFATQLNIEKEQLSGICSSSIGRLEGTYRITDDNILPDWMNNVDIETGKPDKDIVTYDLKEDEQAKQRLVEQFEYLASKKGYLAESARSKGRKTISRNADKYRRLFPYDELDLAQFVMFLANTDGMTYYDVDPQSIDQLSPTQINYKRPTRLVAAFFNTKDVLLGDKKVRQALNHLIQKDFISGGILATGPIPSTSWTYSENVKKYEYDVKKAEELLKDLDKSIEKKITISTTRDYEDIAKQIAEDWTAGGFNVEIKNVRGVPDSFQVLVGAQNISSDPDQYSLWHSTQVKTNLTQLSNVRIDKLLEDGRQTIAQSARQQQYNEFQKYLVDEAPAVFLYFPDKQISVIKKHFPDLEEILSSSNFLVR